jgi:hypothetical protein
MVQGGENQGSDRGKGDAEIPANSVPMEAQYEQPKTMCPNKNVSRGLVHDNLLCHANEYMILARSPGRHVLLQISQSSMMTRATLITRTTLQIQI